MCNGVSLWFYLTFLRILIRLHIFSYIWWPFRDPIFWHVHLDLCLVFIQLVLFSLLNYKTNLSTLITSPFIGYMCCKHMFPFSGLYFYSLKLSFVEWTFRKCACLSCFLGANCFSTSHSSMSSLVSVTLYKGVPFPKINWSWS